MSVEYLSREGFYPLSDRMPGPNIFNNQYRARWTGEKRIPKKGEWYLSGSRIEAYRAPNDLLTEYHIARIVKVRKVEYFVEVPHGSGS